MTARAATGQAAAMEAAAAGYRIESGRPTAAEAAAAIGAVAAVLSGPQAASSVRGRPGRDDPAE